MWQIFAQNITRKDFVLLSCAVTDLYLNKYNQMDQFTFCTDLRRKCVVILVNVLVMFFILASLNSAPFGIVTKGWIAYCFLFLLFGTSQLFVNKDSIMLLNIWNYPRDVLVFLNFTEHQILWRLSSVVFDALTMKLPIQTSLSVLRELPISLSSHEKYSNFRKTSTPKV